MEGLYARTGQESVFISVRSDRNHYSKPFFLVSSQRIEEHFKKVIGMMPEVYASKLEVFCLDRADGKLPPLKTHQVAYMLS